MKPINENNIPLDILETIIDGATDHEDGFTGILKCCDLYCQENNIDESLAIEAATVWFNREALSHGIPLEVIQGKAKLSKQPLDYSLIDNIEVDGIDTRDYPDFCDAYISNATYNSVDMSDEQLENINNDREFVYEQVLNRLY